MRRPRKPKVYFVERMGYIKIGTTRHLGKRLRDLACVGVTMPPGVTPGKVEVLLVVRGSERKERWLHKRFAHARVAGEWFHPTPDLLAYIEALKHEQTNRHGLRDRDDESGDSSHQPAA